MTEEDREWKKAEERTERRQMRAEYRTKEDGTGVDRGGQSDSGRGRRTEEDSGRHRGRGGQSRERKDGEGLRREEEDRNPDLPHASSPLPQSPSEHISSFF
jgi:hypothetical protein